MTDREIIADWHKGRDYGDAEVRTYLGPIRESCVTQATVTAAKAAIEVAVADLGIKRPKVLWLDRCPPYVKRKHLDREGMSGFEHSGIRGIAHKRAGALGIDGGLSPAEAAETAAHECYHLVCAGTHSRDEYDAEEVKAVAYGELVADLLTTHSLLKNRPGTHVIDDAPGRSTLINEAYRGDVLTAPSSSGATKGWLNVGPKYDPRWVAIRSDSSGL